MGSYQLNPCAEWGQKLPIDKALVHFISVSFVTLNTPSPELPRAALSTFLIASSAAVQQCSIALSALTCTALRARCKAAPYKEAAAAPVVQHRALRPRDQLPAIDRLRDCAGEEGRHISPVKEDSREM
jgi:hypothetical protein